MQLSIEPPLTSRTYEVEDFTAAQEFFHSRGWTDGLPVVPPTPAAVEACLEWSGMPADQLLGIEPVRAATMARTAARRFKDALAELLVRDGVSPERVDDALAEFAGAGSTATLPEQPDG